jgi:Cof subfamily protein (haloacid dehalogenase superfamily)
MSYKLIALDMDGTLLTKDKKVTPKTQEAMRTAIDKGFIVTLCTGRPLQGLYEYLYLITPDAPVVTYNGGVVLTSKSCRVLFSKTLEAPAAVETVRRGLERGAVIIVWADGKLYVSEDSEFTEKYARLSGSKKQLLGEKQYLTIARQGITKIIWMDKPEKINEHIQHVEINPVYGTRAVTSAPSLLEFMDESASKAEGLKIIAEYYGLDSSEIIAVGDNYNDLDMLRYAGLGAAMGNAPEEIKSAVDYVTLSNEEDGVAAVIKKFLL